MSYVATIGVSKCSKEQPSLHTILPKLAIKSNMTAMVSSSTTFTSIKVIKTVQIAV